MRAPAIMQKSEVLGAAIFFHTVDGDRDRDQEGIELADLSAARVHAIEFAGDVMSDEPSVLWDGRDFRVEVTDQSDTLFFAVITLAVNPRGWRHEVTIFL